MAGINLARIHASYFFDFCDEEFVIEVYDKLLGRAPDPVGLSTFLPLIRAGESRYLVLDGIANSAEAREFGVQLLGMRPYRRMRKWCKIPVVGRVIHAVLLLWHAGEMMKDLRALENHLYRITKITQL